MSVIRATTNSQYIHRWIVARCRPPHKTTCLRHHNLTDSGQPHTCAARSISTSPTSDDAGGDDVFDDCWRAGLVIVAIAACHCRRQRGTRASAAAARQSCQSRRCELRQSFICGRLRQAHWHAGRIGWRIEPRKICDDAECWLVVDAASCRSLCSGGAAKPAT